MTVSALRDRLQDEHLDLLGSREALQRRLTNYISHSATGGVTIVSSTATSVASQMPVVSPSSKRPRKQKSVAINNAAILPENNAPAMKMCTEILRLLRKKDFELGSFFRVPVDPVALQLPTYFKIIKEPMDLYTLQTKVDSGEVNTPVEFARLSRLMFENAMRFNTHPHPPAHQSAQILLIYFNEYFAQ
ncbi:MAG: hypothetical protein SGARI_003005, partial [Bacillariaceae sp.]